MDPSFWAGQATIGGSEHDIWEMEGEYWKATRPDRFGWTVLPGDHGFPEISEATPLEYLERWMNANRVLGDRAKLRGIATTDDGVQVIISQPFIDGPYPNSSAVSKEMAKRGFAEVAFAIGSETNTTFYDDVRRLAAFDASSDNFILSNGIPIPIDVIVIRVGEILRRQLLDLIEL